MDDDQGAQDDFVDSYEDVSVFHLDDDRERNLLETQTECTFMWTTKDGDPVGVIMNFVSHDDRFWITCTRRRKRVAAVEARPRVAICVTSRGTDIGVSQSITSAVMRTTARCCMGCTLTRCAPSLSMELYAHA